MLERSGELQLSRQRATLTPQTSRTDAFDPGAERPVLPRESFFRISGELAWFLGNWRTSRRLGWVYVRAEDVPAGNACARISRSSSPRLKSEFANLMLRVAHHEPLRFHAVFRQEGNPAVPCVTLQ
jgi:hypothetical protein